MNIINWYTSYVTGIVRLSIKKISKHGYEIGNRYAGRPVSNRDEIAEAISCACINCTPYMVCRFGADELNTTIATIAYRNGLGSKLLEKSHRKRLIYYSAGLFPELQEIQLKFGDMMIEACNSADVLGVWNLLMEDYVIRNYTNRSLLLSRLNALEPWYNPSNPWTKSLKGKKVLVISPFVESIKKQYVRRKELFPGTDILPEFELKTVKAVISGGGQIDSRFHDWFEALDYMYNESMKEDFDIAILGCASYGFPLAARFKAAGKVAIQLGGATQLLFGIKGGRWDNHPVVSKFYNDFWIRPAPGEQFANTKIIENGCYW